MNILPSVLSVELSSLLYHCFWSFFDHNNLLCGNALLRREASGDGGDDSGAVAAAVGGGQGQEGGGDDENLQMEVNIISLYYIVSYIILEQTFLHQEEDGYLHFGGLTEDTEFQGICRQCLITRSTYEPGI